jgi:transcriptional regulator with XRE-family HTH domain
MPTNADLGRALARVRTQRGLSIGELADLAECTPAWLADAERGVFSPAWSEIGLLAEALDLPLSKLIEEVEREAGAREAYRRARENPPSEL